MLNHYTISRVHARVVSGAISRARLPIEGMGSSYQWAPDPYFAALPEQANSLIVSRLICHIPGCAVPLALIVDDDARCRMDLSLQLRRSGYDVRDLANGLHVALLDLHVFDAVIIEVFMLHADGLETLRMVKARAPDLPVIGITARLLGFDNGCIRAMYALGAEAVLEKPVDVARLLKILDVAVAARYDARRDCQGTDTA